VAARLRCDTCDREWQVDVPAFRCSACGGVADVVAGQELEVESIDVRQEEPCIA
jgi:hydrogenase nickel incorporation protein HypA/HybF